MTPKSITAKRLMSHTESALVVGEGAKTDVRLFLNAEEPQENPADAGGAEDPGNREGPPVDGAELLDDLERFAGRFLALPTNHHLVVLCLWAVHTWAVERVLRDAKACPRLTRAWLRQDQGAGSTGAAMP